MAVDSSNILRVELLDIYQSLERISAHRSEAHDGGETVDVLAIVQDDREDVYPDIMLACAKIADAANYVQNQDQNGLDALTRTSDGIYEGYTLDYVPEKEKMIGESLDPNTRDILVFSHPELENFTPNKYTIVQEYIKEAIVRFVLSRWYHMKNLKQYSIEEEELFEEALSEIKFNSVTNKKRKSVKLPYKYY
ncbi:MAG: hypothetical protein VYB44_07085 [Bacteroidota bacterium]|nr:hypothetical protein [Bacteroidota bacterium]